MDSPAALVNEGLQLGLTLDYRPGERLGPDRPRRDWGADRLHHALDRLTLPPRFSVDSDLDIFQTFDFDLLFDRLEQEICLSASDRRTVNPPHDCELELTWERLEDLPTLDQIGEVVA